MVSLRHPNELLKGSLIIRHSPLPPVLPLHLFGFFVVLERQLTHVAPHALQGSISCMPSAARRRRRQQAPRRRVLTSSPSLSQQFSQQFSSPVSQNSQHTHPPSPPAVYTKECALQQETRCPPQTQTGSAASQPSSTRLHIHTHPSLCSRSALPIPHHSRPDCTLWQVGA